MQITSGIRRILSNPVVYSIFQYVMGAHAFWRAFVSNMLKLEKNALILDIGCGPADILDYLPKDVQYWGFDISDAYISNAKKKYGSRGNFFCKYLDEQDIHALPKFDRVLLTGVLHHMDDDVALQVLDLAKLALKPNGILITVDPCLCEGQNPIARFLIMKDRGQNVRKESEYSSLISQVFQNAQTQVVHKFWVPYTHCFMMGSK